MNLSTCSINRYRRSLKHHLQYRVADHWSLEFNCHLVEALGLILNSDHYMDDFLTRYPIQERTRRRSEVKRVICLWLCEFATP